MDPRARPTPPARVVTVSGTVVPGVETGCLMLGGYQLIGGPPEVLAAGRTVRVTGRPSPDLVTTAQQGTPLVVLSAEPA